MKSKLRTGRRVTSLDQLYDCEFVNLNGKTYHRGWVRSWQFRLAADYIRSGKLFEAVRLTNAEYYPEITREEAFKRFAEDLHDVCPFGSLTAFSGVNVVCHGAYCQKAFELWKERPVK